MSDEPVAHLGRLQLAHCAGFCICEQLKPLASMKFVKRLDLHLAVAFGRKLRLVVQAQEIRHTDAAQLLVPAQVGLTQVPICFDERSKLTAVELVLVHFATWGSRR